MRMLMLALALAAAVPPPSTLYFVGDALITDVMAAGRQHGERVLLIRQIEPGRSRIVERACVVPTGRPASLSTMFMAVSGETMAISDRETGAGGLVSGQGRLIGEPWQWRELHFDMQYASPQMKVQIADINLLVPGRLIARKQVSLPAGPIVQLWEADLRETAEALFWQEWKLAGCPAAG